jgi:hypothetical protein
MEGISLYRMLGSKKSADLTTAYWQRMVEGNQLPERSWESLKKFWHIHEKKPVEHFLCDAIHKKYDFCLSFSHIPNVKELEESLRNKYEEYFIQLEKADDDGSDQEELFKVD